jgi:hypothetical protein
MLFRPSLSTPFPSSLSLRADDSVCGFGEPELALGYLRTHQQCRRTARSASGPSPRRTGALTDDYRRTDSFRSAEGLTNAASASHADGPQLQACDPTERNRDVSDEARPARRFASQAARDKARQDVTERTTTTASPSSFLSSGRVGRSRKLPAAGAVLCANARAAAGRRIRVHGPDARIHPRRLFGRGRFSMRGAVRMGRPPGERVRDATSRRSSTSYVPRAWRSGELGKWSESRETSSRRVGGLVAGVWPRFEQQQTDSPTGLGHLRNALA